MTEHPHGIPEPNTEKSNSTCLRISTKFKQLFSIKCVSMHYPCLQYHIARELLYHLQISKVKLRAVFTFPKQLVSGEAQTRTPGCLPKPFPLSLCCQAPGGLLSLSILFLKSNPWLHNLRIRCP